MLLEAAFAPSSADWEEEIVLTGKQWKRHTFASNAFLPLKG